MHKDFFDVAPKPWVAGWSTMTMLVAAVVSRLVFFPSTTRKEARSSKLIDKKKDALKFKCPSQVPEPSVTRALGLSEARAPWLPHWPLSCSCSICYSEEQFNEVVYSNPVEAVADDEKFDHTVETVTREPPPGLEDLAIDLETETALLYFTFY